MSGGERRDFIVRGCKGPLIGGVPVPSDKSISRRVGGNRHIGPITASRSGVSHSWSDWKIGVRYREAVW